MFDDTSIYAVNDFGEACMRVSANVTSNDPTSIYGVNEAGEAAVRVIGGGGGSDQHNLGWYATQSALETAHPTAEDGDWAIVGATDTVWVWDSDTNTWKDTDQKGQVTSVNGKTGDVVLDLLPDQTGQSGKFLTTDGTKASWSDKPLANTATTANALNILGQTSTATNYTSLQATIYSNNAVGIGYGASVMGEGGIAIGRAARVIAAYAIQLGGSNNATNSTANTLKFGNANGNYEIISADGTIPTARLTKVSTTVTLAAADWSSNSQTVNVTGMTATGLVFVSPIPADQADYTSAGIVCSAQAAGTLTFTCDTVPSGDIDVTVVMM